MLYQHCADLDVMVEWCRLRPGRRGSYRFSNNTIQLGLHLSRRQAIATLAHEVGHQRFGDTCSTPANERRAWEFGAALVITPLEYRAAEGQVGSDARALAIELDVTPKLIEAWRRWWLVRGQFIHAALLDVDTADV